MSYRPRSSLPAEVPAWLAARLACLVTSRPPGTGGTPPLSLEIRLDAVASASLPRVGYCQPDGSFVTSLDDLGQWLGEMAASGEAVCLDGLATRVQRPGGWANQKVL